jgi:hypothetical protein
MVMMENDGKLAQSGGSAGNESKPFVVVMRPIQRKGLT